eukprot:jgi/Botrbrau1/2352/Bobra.39_1s0037.1
MKDSEEQLISVRARQKRLRDIMKEAEVDHRAKMDKWSQRLEELQEEERRLMENRMNTAPRKSATSSAAPPGFAAPPPGFAPRPPGFENAVLVAPPKDVTQMKFGDLRSLLSKNRTGARLGSASTHSQHSDEGERPVDAREVIKSRRLGPASSQGGDRQGSASPAGTRSPRGTRPLTTPAAKSRPAACSPAWAPAWRRMTTLMMKTWRISISPTAITRRTAITRTTASTTTMDVTRRMEGTMRMEGTRRPAGASGSSVMKTVPRTMRRKRSPGGLTAGFLRRERTRKWRRMRGLLDNRSPFLRGPPTWPCPQSGAALPLQWIQICSAGSSNCSAGSELLCGIRIFLRNRNFSAGSDLLCRIRTY